jgi:pimeloyl-ACP methyl ester carboxylesterase
MAAWSRGSSSLSPATKLPFSYPEAGLLCLYMDRRATPILGIDSFRHSTARFRVISVDLPGPGPSDAPKSSYTMDLFAHAIDAVLNHAGVDQAVLAGHSMGTPVMRQFYRRFSKKTFSLIMVDSPTA